jgi:hypothetical protein
MKHPQGSGEFIKIKKSCSTRPICRPAILIKTSTTIQKGVKSLFVNRVSASRMMSLSLTDVKEASEADIKSAKLPMRQIFTQLPDEILELFS